MIQEWLEKGIFLYVMAGICGVSILSRLILSWYLGRLLYSTANMQRAVGGWPARVMQEYDEMVETCGQVNDVDIFVDKCVGAKKMAGVMLSTWDKFGGQTMLLCGGVLLVAGGAGIFYQADKELVLFTIFIGIWMVILNLIADNLANLSEKKEQLKRNLKHYFENQMPENLEIEEMDPYNDEDIQGENIFETSNESWEYESSDWTSRKESEKDKIKKNKNSAKTSKEIPLESETVNLSAESKTDADSAIKNQTAELEKTDPVEKSEEKKEIKTGAADKLVNFQDKTNKNNSENETKSSESLQEEIEQSSAAEEKTPRSKKESKKASAAQKKRERMKQQLMAEMDSEQSKKKETELLNQTEQASQEKLNRLTESAKKENQEEQDIPVEQGKQILQKNKTKQEKNIETAKQGTEIRESKQAADTRRAVEIWQAEQARRAQEADKANSLEKEQIQKESDASDSAENLSEQVAAASDRMEKKQMTIEEAAAFLASEINKNQDNNRVIEEVLKEFLL